jgi:transketolase
VRVGGEREGQHGPVESADHPAVLLGAESVGWNLGAYAARAEAFGARVLTIDGHDLTAVDEALTAAATGAGGRPTVILAKTVKGEGFTEVEDSPDWHGKPFPQEMAERAVAELGGPRHLTVRGPPETGHGETLPAVTTRPAGPVTYEIGAKVASRKAYGDALVALGARDPRVVALDGEVGNSTYAFEFADAHPDRYFEMFIAEQQMVAAATGLAVRGYRPYASTFAAFLTRAYDFIRMASSSGVDLHITHLAVRGMPGSGTGEELLAWAGIDTGHIAAAARQLLAGR